MGDAGEPEQELDRRLVRRGELGAIRIVWRRHVTVVSIRRLISAASGITKVIPLRESASVPRLCTNTRLHGRCRRRSDHEGAPPAEPARKFKFPTAFTVLAAVLLLVWIASFFIPAGRYKTDPQTGRAGARHVPRAAVVLGGGGRRHRARRRLAGRDRRRRRPTPQSAPGAKVTPDPGVNCVDTAFTYRFKQLWNAPPNGLYGVEASNGFVGPWEEGFLYGSAAIFFFVLAVGAFITVTMKTRGDPDRASAGSRCASGTAAPS